MNDPRDSAKSDAPQPKTLTLRLPVELHEQVERAAKDSQKSLNQFFSDAAAAILNGTTIAGSPTLLRAAIYIDVDAIGAESGIGIDLDAIERTVTGDARVVMRRAIASTDTPTSEKRILLARNYSFMEALSREALRLQLTADAMESVLMNRADLIAVVTADENLQGLPANLQRHGARVIGIGTRPSELTSPDFIRAFDSFRFYNQLVSPPGSAELRRLRDQYADALVFATHRLESRGAKTVGSAIIPLLRDKHPELSLETLEMRSWRELAETAYAAGLLQKIESSGTDFLLRVSEKGRLRAQELSTAAESEKSSVDEVQQVRKAIEDIFGTALPNTKDRFSIYNAVQWVLSQQPSSDAGIGLIDLSFRISEQLNGALSQNFVYRVLFGLYRAGAFDFEENRQNEHDPRLIRVRIPFVHIDNFFVINLMKVRRRFPVGASAEILSSVLFDSPNEAPKVLRLLKVSAEPLGRAELLDAVVRELG
jgi:hypothetical protein